MVYLLSAFLLTAAIGGSCSGSNSTSPAGANTGGPVDSASTSATDSAWLLVPGKSAGKTKINEDADQLLKRMGKPDAGDAAMGKSLSFWYAGHDTSAHSIAVFTTRQMGVEETALVKEIRVTSPDFKTIEGLHVTSTLTDIQKCHAVKPVDNFEYNGIKYTVYDDPEGIAFELSPQSQCVAIIIHEKGKPGEGSYMKSRSF